jgi:proteasome accessory factor B
MKNKKAVGKQVRSIKTARKRMAVNGAATLNVKRSPLVRIKRMLELMQEGKYPNCSTIAEEMEVSLSSVGRDIDYMRNELELPMEYDEQRHGFYLTKPVDRFPMVQMTQRELFYVFVAHKGIEHYRGTTLEKPLEQAFKKFAGRLDDEDQIYLQSMDDVLSIRPFAPDDGDLHLFEVLTQGITERRLLKFQYKKPGEKTRRPRRVHPYHMLEFGGWWYLIAYDVEQKVVRKYRLGRMQDLELTKERFTDRKDFDPKTYFKGSVGVVTGEGDYDVVIEMDAWLTDMLRGRRFDPKQVWTEFPDGGSYLKLRLNSLEEIEHHVLSWGTHATVIGPVELRQRLFEIAKELSERYSDSVETREGVADGRCVGEELNKRKET